jgi:hypothetical protein
VCDNGTNSDVRVAKASTAFHWQQEEERTFVLLLQWSRITFAAVQDNLLVIVSCC